MYLNEWLTTFMFLFCLLSFLSGYPIFLCLGGSAALFAGIGAALGEFNLNFLNALPVRIVGILDNDLLMSVPYFVFMGALLERSGLAQDLLDNIMTLSRRVKGNLAYAILVIGAVLGACTGTVAATVIPIAMIGLPALQNYNYKNSFSLGLVASTGTLGQIVPPSLILVILSGEMGVHLSHLFRSAFIPAITLIICFAIYIFFASQKEEVKSCKEEGVSNKSSWRIIVWTVVIPVFLIASILGSISAGVATANEAGALGCLAVVILTLFDSRLDSKVIKESSYQTVFLTSVMMAILIASTTFSLVIQGLDGDLMIRNFLTNLPGGKWGFLFFLMITLFFLGFVMDFIEICFIIIPIILPAAQHLEIDLVWLCILISLNLQTSFITPPMGFSLFYLKSVMNRDIFSIPALYKGVIPFIIIQLTVMFLVMLFPQFFI